MPLLCCPSQIKQTIMAVYPNRVESLRVSAKQTVPLSGTVLNMTVICRIRLGIVFTAAVTQDCSMHMLLQPLRQHWQ